METHSRHKSPALVVAGLVAAGILIGRSDLHLTLPAALLILTASLVLLALVTHRTGRSAQLRAPLLLPVIPCVLVGFALIRQTPDDGGEAFHRLQGRQVVIVGRVTQPPDDANGRLRMQLLAEWVKAGDTIAPFPRTLQVTLLPRRDSTRGPRPVYGMTVALRGVVEYPSDARNPGEFSPRQYFQANGIDGLMLVKGADQMIVVRKSGGWWFLREAVFPLRRHVLATIDATIGGEEGEFMKGLLIGARGGLSALTQRAFMDSGVAHILAVSGSNVAVVAAALIFLLGFFRIPRQLHGPPIITGLLMYMWVTGSQPPVVRATIMALVFLAGTMARQRPQALNSCGVAALIMFMIDPRQLFDIGFELSFAAVLSIIILYPRLNAVISRIRGRSLPRKVVIGVLRLAAVSVAASIGTLPLTALAFGRVSLIGVVANMIVVPASGISVILGMAGAALAPVSAWSAASYGAVNGWLLRATIDVAWWCAAAPFATVDMMRFQPVYALPLYAGLLLACSTGSRVGFRRATILLLLALNVAVLVPHAHAVERSPGALRVSMVDVGQGDGILLESPGGGTVLVDAGPAPKEPGYDAAILPFLRRRGIRRIDVLILTHAHDDHAGGLADLLRNVEIGRIFTCGVVPVLPPFEKLRALLSGRRNLDTAAAGMCIAGIPGLRVYVLAPPQGTWKRPGVAEEDLNRTSVVIKVIFAGVAVLLTGDAERTEEIPLVERYADFLRADILKVGHHGSRAGTSAEFLDAVRPAWALVSVGRYNRFGHPSPSTLQRLTERNVEVARTDEDGALIFESDGTSWQRIDWR